MTQDTATWPHPSAAELRSLARRVALKVLPIRALTETVAVERFRRESRLAARLHHTNIVPVFEVGQEGDVCFYAMQFIPGQSLDRVVARLRGSSPSDTLDRGDHSRFPNLPTSRHAAPPTGRPAHHVGSGASATDRLAPEAGEASPPDQSGAVPGPARAAPAHSRLDYDTVARVGLQAAQALAY